MAGLFGDLPQPTGPRRPLTQEELEDEAIAEELADLPDDEGMEEPQGPAPVLQELRRRPRHQEEDEEEEAPSSNLGRRRRQEEEEPEEEAVQHVGDLRKRPRQQEEGSSSPAPHPVQQEGPPQPAAAQTDDQVATAIRRITSHISNPSKFAKAAQLLRRLIDSGALGPQHRSLVFEAVRAVFSLQPGKHKHLVDLVNKRETIKLMALVEGMAAGGFFSKAERAQIQDVYHLLGVTCNEMHTDDSFVFSKVLSKVRESVDALPEVKPGDEDDLPAYQHVTADLPGTYKPTTTQPQDPAAAEPAEPQPSHEEQSPQPDEQQAAPQAAGGGDAVDPDDPFGLDAFITPAEDDDPFGLGSLMSAQELKPVKRKPKAVKPPEPVSTAWGPAELLAARRCAVLMCVQHARTFHKHTWAQTGIELLAEHCWKHRSKFSAGQQAEIDELWVWVRKSRTIRKQGPSAKEIKRDTSTFEKARAEWSKATVSARGKVGSSGDAKAANWLG